MLVVDLAEAGASQAKGQFHGRPFTQWQPNTADSIRVDKSPAESGGKLSPLTWGCSNM